MAPDDSVNTEISLLDEVKIQARTADRTERGQGQPARPDRSAGRVTQLVDEPGSQLPGHPREKRETTRNALYPRIGDDIDIEMR